MMGWVHEHFCAPDLVGVLEGHSHASIAGVEGCRREEISARWRDARLLASVNILPVDAPPVKHVGWITLSRLAVCPGKAVNSSIRQHANVRRYTGCYRLRPARWKGDSCQKGQGIGEGSQVISQGPSRRLHHERHCTLPHNP